MKQSDRIRVLALDLSLSFPAYAILDCVGGEVDIVEVQYTDNKSKGRSKESHAQRLQHIADDLNVLLKTTWGIDYVVRERGFSQHNATTQALFKVVGVSELEILRLTGIYIATEIPPTTVKKYLTGNGKASKDEVEAGIRKYLSEEQKDYRFASDDCSDAVAVGISFLLQQGFIERL